MLENENAFGAADKQPHPLTSLVADPQGVGGIKGIIVAAHLKFDPHTALTMSIGDSPTVYGWNNVSKSFELVSDAFPA